MTTHISITTRQTEELIRKWIKADKNQRFFNIVLLICWTVISIARIAMGIARPDDWMNWISAGLAAILVGIWVANTIDPALLHRTKTTTLTVSAQFATIFMEQNGKTHRYSVDWSKVRVQEHPDYYVFQVNFHLIQIFRKEDLSACTQEAFSTFLRAKIGARYVVK